MDISHITSQSLRSLLSLTEKKDELLQGIEEVHAEIIRTLQGGVVGVVEIIKSQTATPRSASAAKTPVAVAPVKTVKPAKAKRRMSAEGRARISAATKARWAARRTVKAAKVVVASKAAKPAKKKRNLSPEGRARIAAAMKARWAAHKAGKSDAPTKPAPMPIKQRIKAAKKA